MADQALLFWSSGKDSAYALHLLRSKQDLEVVGLVTTVNRPAHRVAVHAVREALLGAQAVACGLPLIRIVLPDPCPNAVYEAAVLRALEKARGEGISTVVFGDLYLQDIRTYREKMLAESGLKPLFPLWGRDTNTLAREMLASGLRARIICVDTHVLDRCFAGREFDREFLSDLPEQVDHCGENGEFHTFCYSGPMFQAPIAVKLGQISSQANFVYADLLEGR